MKLVRENITTFKKPKSEEDFKDKLFGKLRFTEEELEEALDKEVFNFVDNYPEYSWIMNFSFAKNMIIKINKDGYVGIMFSTPENSPPGLRISGGLTSQNPVSSLSELIYELNHMGGWE